MKIYSSSNWGTNKSSDTFTLYIIFLRKCPLKKYKQMYFLRVVVKQVHFMSWNTSLNLDNILSFLWTEADLLYFYPIAYPLQGQ